MKLYLTLLVTALAAAMCISPAWADDDDDDGKRGKKWAKEAQKRQEKLWKEARKLDRRSDEGWDRLSDRRYYQRDNVRRFDDDFDLDDNGGYRRRKTYREVLPPPLPEPSYRSGNDYYEDIDSGYVSPRYPAPPRYQRRHYTYSPPYDSYYDEPVYGRRGTRIGSNIGSQIGGLIGGSEGAAIGAQIGADIGAEVDRDNYRDPWH